jgi:hypothetical protein
MGGNDQVWASGGARALPEDVARGVCPDIVESEIEKGTPQDGRAGRLAEGRGRHFAKPDLVGNRLRFRGSCAAEGGRHGGIL